MDLDTIQDLLGGSNLPPPPSVQDLLGDVVPIPRSPSPPAAPPPSLQLSAEHNYSKGPSDSAGEPVDSSASSSGSETLAPLNTSFDCYEAFLLNLLRVYTQNRIDGAATAGTVEQAGTGSQLYTIDDISPESISVLSQEQIQSLVTSNSTNYDVIHQVLAYRQRLEGGGGGGGGESVSGEGVQGEKSSNEAMSALQQLQALQLTPEQLKQIQLQMAELIRTKQIILPTELSLDQQHQLLQSLILKQVHSQHQHLTAATTASVTTTTTTQPSAASTPSVPPSSTTATSSTGSSGSSKSMAGSTLAAMLRKDVEKKNGGVGRGKTVKMEVPPASNLSTPDTNTVPLELSSNPVADGSSAKTDATASQSMTTRSGGRKKKDAKDEDEPKKPSSPYGVFFSDVYPSVLQANPSMTFSEASKLISAMWNAMGGDTKKQYHERSEKQKEVYQTHLATHTAETAPTDPPVAPQTPAVDAPQTVAQATKHTLQVEMTAEVGLPVAMTDSQEQKHPGPAPTHPKLVVKDLKHCVNDGCFKDAVYTEFRGPRYCSNECVVQHCRSVFQEWVSQRKVTT